MIRNVFHKLATISRAGAVFFVLAIALLNPAAANAQGDPRSNVNLIGMTPDPADFPDTSYRQQNEPACAIRPGDSACIICAYNDYRGVDAFGDAWEGVSQSCDAGDTWKSRLAPGHPLYDPVNYRIPAEFAADPRLAAIPGMAIFNFIAGYRESNDGVLAIQHWLEVNKEDADFYEPGVETYIADEGTSGRFLDKPDMVAVLDGRGTITLDTVMENTDLGTISRAYPSGTLYVAYAVFTGSNSVKVLVKTSDDWGRTFKNQAIKLSEDQNQVSGITLTAIGDKVLAVWRRKGDGNDPDSIIYSVITNGGKKATKGEVLADICAFDQPTLTGSETDFNVVTFRTNDFPWTANDGENFYVFYSDRERVSPGGACLTDEAGNPNGKPRIVMHHSTLSGQATWTDYGPIDQTADAKTFQFMPTAFGANGKVQVAWYDTRRDLSDPLNLAFVADYDSLYAGSGFLVNRTVDVFTTTITENNLLNPGTIPAPVRASQFSILVNEEEGTRKEYETEASFANKKLFAQGKAPFLGDYIAMAAREYRRNNQDTAWESNASAVPNQTEDFFVAWTDNRDVRGTIDSVVETLPYTTSGAQGTTTSTLDTGSGDEAEKLVADVLQDVGPPRDTTQTAEGIDGSDDFIGTCAVGEGDFSRTRDANIYGSLIKDRERIYAPNPSKPLGGLQRAFPVVLSNSDGEEKKYTLKIVPGACTGTGCKASFRQELPGDSTTTVNEPPLNSPAPWITVPAKSSIARTVFVSGKQSPVKVQAFDYPSGDLVATIQLANSPETEEFRNPENCVAAQAADPNVVCSVATNELHNLELQTVDAYLLAVLSGQVSNLDAYLVLGNDASSLIEWAVAGVVGDGSGDVDGDGVVDGVCCEGEDPPTYGSVIEYANKYLAFETTNIETGEPLDLVPDANLLNNTPNANLLNAALLNANLLNANLLNANLLNAALLNANLLNSSPTDLTGLNASFVAQAEEGGCCEPFPAPSTYGEVIMWHLSNPELTNASLLNAALLNANLLNLNLENANLLNANLLNANLLNANLLNADLLNANLLNANLLNPTVEAANLLNANLLNADLLNANLLNPTLVEQAVDAGCCGNVAPELADPGEVIKYAVGHPEIINASLLNASLLNANLLNANLLNANLLNANLLNANLLNANLLNANLLNANLLNANLLNADLLNANLLNANLLNSSLTDVSAPDPVTGDQTVTVKVGDDQGIPQPYDGDVTFDDYTYPITNNGNVTTAIDADITINAPIVTVDGEEALDVIGTKLIIWTTNATPTVVDCVERVQLNTRVQSITSPDSNFEVADIKNPFKGQTSAVVAPGETVFVTLRVVGTTEQLKNVRVSGFTASSQAANCSLAIGCDDALNIGIEQITFADQTPPVITVPDDIIVEAANAGGTVVDYSDSVSVFDASDANPSLECLPESGSVFPLGSTPVTCNATDASGNQADSAEFNVVVQDTSPPGALVGLPASITLEAESSAGAQFSWNPVTALDVADGTITASCSPVSGSTFPLGATGTIVTCTATDSALLTSSGSFTVTVEDTTPPGPLDGLPADITLEAESSTGASYDWGGLDAVTAIDAVDGSITAICSPASGSTFAVGTTGTVVTCTATDSAGLTSNGSFTVTVEDTTPPGPLDGLPVDITLEATSTGGAEYSWNSVTALDVVDGSITAVCSPASGSTFVLGATGTVVTCTATDSAGLTSIGSFTVTVEDTTPPSITAPVDVALDASGELTSDYICSDFGDPIVSDLFGVSSVACSPTTGLVLGANTITWTVTDGNLITASTTQTVTLVDTLDPIIDPVIPIIGFEPQGTYPYELSADLNADLNTILVSWPVSVTDSDQSLTISCSIDGAQATPLTTNPTTGEDGYPKVEDGKVVAWFKYEFGPGDTAVSCTATDSQGQEATFDFTVSVFDITPPVISVPSEPVTITLPDENGSFEYDYSSLVSVTDNADANPTLECRTNPDDIYSTNFIDLLSYGETIVECRAQDAGPSDDDGSVNVSTAEFKIIARYRYDIEVIVSKKRANLGSTIPVDWLYRDWDGNLVDSSQFDVGITWETTSDCINPDGTGPSGEDSGSSDFRYSASSGIWQYSLQTKDLIGDGQKYLITIEPPGLGIESASVCVTLR